ncbi:MAG: response regulator [Nitrospirae bacterium]|uniref:response regulator n=1 Tax=Candidatus Magnetobacterium casense TaxID=1455061 RepID=UPI0009DD69DA|nr:response regulator [Candidatus Magnetobacterium casensis]MBF0336479.1 response regulator [Nitrospirota bacterium]
MPESSNISYDKVPTGINILVVEDEIVIARDIESKLKKIGYNVPAIAASGEEAIKLAGEVHPTLILMDIMLEGKMDGVEAAGQIDKLYGIPIIYLTAHSDLDTLHRAKITEPFGYILKPFSQRDLLVTIGMALYKHRMEAKQKIVNTVLRVFLEPIDLSAKLEKTLKLLVSIPRLFLQTKGTVYLVDNDRPDMLVVKAAIGTPVCTTVPFGQCLCGHAASDNAIIFADRIDKRHELHQDGMPHGHYCAPIRANNRVVGVINTYVMEGYKRDVSDEAVLSTVSDIIANYLIASGTVK